MFKHTILLLLFSNMIAAATIAEFNLNNGYAWYENSNALINCTAVSNELIAQETVCDFKYKGTPTITLNTSFVFNSADGVTPKSIYLWQNISHTEYSYVQTMQNNSIIFGNVSSVKTSTASCYWGAGATKRNVTFTNGTSRVYCFDSYINNSGIYTLYSNFEVPILTPTTKYYYDWNDITSSLVVSNFGSYKVRTSQATWATNQLRKIKLMYNTMPNTNGKFDIYFHLGSAQDAYSNPSLIKLILDPWWNSTWTHVRDINTTGASNSGNAPYTMPVVINSTVARGSNNNCTDFRAISSDDTTAYPIYIEFCQQNLTNFFPLANSNTTVMWVNVTDGATQLKLYYGNPSAANISNNGSVFKLFKNAEDGTTQSPDQSNQVGTMTNIYNSFLGSYNFYLNDTSGTGVAVLNWFFSTDNKTTLGFEEYYVETAASSYGDFCGGWQTSSGMNDCGNTAHGWFSRYTNAGNEIMYHNGGVFTSYTIKPYAPLGAVTRLTTYFINNRSINTQFSNSTVAYNVVGSNLQAYSLENVTKIMSATGSSAGTTDRSARDNIKVFATLNMTYNTTLGAETNFSSAYAPSIINLSLAPAVPYDSDNLYCAFYAEDNDSPTLNMTVKWFNSSNYVTGEIRLSEPVNATYNFTLSNTYTLPWEKWLCEVNITDGYTETKLNSSNITIYNKLPNASVVNGGAHVFGIPLTCSAQLVDLDLTHILDANISYLINGTAAPTYTEQFFNKNNGDMITNITGTVVDITVGSNWTCYVNVSDNWNMTSTLLTSNYTVTIGAGTSPTSTISISPLNPVNTDDLLCSATVTDVDGHLLTGNISWYLNGSATATSFTTFTNISSGFTQTSTLSNADTLQSENWSCLINFTDGYWQISNMSSNVTIATTFVIPIITVNITTHNYTWDDGTTNSVVHVVEAFYADYDDLIYAILVFAFSFIITKTIPQTMIAGGVGCFVVFFLVGANIYFMVGSIICIIIGLIYKQVVG